MKLQISIEEFGALVRDKRTDLGWTQEALAAEALSNADRKGYISQIENGKLPNISALTVQKIATALEIDRRQVDEMLGVVAPDAGEVRDEIDRLRAEKGSLEAALTEVKTLNRGQLIALAVQFEGANVVAQSDGALVEFLTKKSQDYKALKAEIDAIDDGMKRLANLKKAAHGAIAAGNLDEVETILSRVQEVELEEAAKTAELRAANALLRGRVADAARIYGAAAESFGGIGAAEVADRFDRYLEHLYRHGLRYGGAGLAFAIDFGQRAVYLIDEVSEPERWGRYQNNLGNALAEQGERTGGAEGAGLLAEAVAAYRAALRVYTEEAHPVDWAGTQNNLGAALRNQGSRTGGVEGTALLAEAVAAYRTALRVRTEEAHPVQWAQTQNNLGNSLANQGIRTGGGDDSHGALALLAEAVAAYRAALRVSTEEAHPVVWAATQNNLGNALRNQGSRTGGGDDSHGALALLAEAVVAYRAALRVRTEEAHPVDWAGTQNNIGNALWAQGIRTGGAEGARLLAEAVAAYRAALRVHTEEAHPVDWAMTQNNFAIALQEQGIRTGRAEGGALLAEAVVAYRAALRVRTEEAHPVDWGESMANIAMAMEALAEHESATDQRGHLEAALEHADEALRVFDAEHMPHHFGVVSDLKDRLEGKLAALGD